MRPSFPNLPNPQSENLLSIFPPRSAHSQERCLVMFSCQVDEVLLELSVKSDGIQPLLQKELLDL